MRFRLVEAVRPTDKLLVIVALLEYVTGDNYSYLLERVPSKTGVRTHYKYCFHHKNNKHTDNSFDNLVILEVRDHDMITRKEKSLDECSHIDLAKVLSKFLNKLQKDSSNTLEEEWYEQ